MTKPKPPCRFYQAGHCRFGSNCNFSHSACIHAGQSPGPSTSVPNSPKSRTPNQPNFARASSPLPTGNPGLSTSVPNSPRNRPPNRSNLPGASSPLPNGVCRFYWETGGCKREFDCKYSHIRCDDRPETTPQRPQFNFSGNDAIAPFLTEQGLAKINGIATDGFFDDEKSTSLSPTEAHNRFKRFLSDNFRFKNSFDVYAFLVSLSSANCNNTRWACISLDLSGIHFTYS